MKLKYLPAEESLWLVKLEGLDSYRTFMAFPKDKALQLIQMCLEAPVVTVNYQGEIERVGILDKVSLEVLPQAEIENFNTKQLLLGEDT